MRINSLETRQAIVKDVDRLKRDTLQIAQDVRQHANAHIDETKQRVTDGVEMVRDLVNAHPLALAGIAFAIGMLTGLALRNKRAPQP